MKRLFFLLSMIFAMSLNAQQEFNLKILLEPVSEEVEWAPAPSALSSKSKLVCYSCNIDQKFSCDGCGLNLELFDGIVIDHSNKQDVALFAPIKVTTRGQQIYFEDAFGTKDQISLGRLDGFSRVRDVLDFVAGCSCSASGGTDVFLQNAINTSDSTALLSMSDGGTFNLLFPRDTDVRLDTIIPVDTTFKFVMSNGDTVFLQLPRNTERSIYDGDGTLLGNRTVTGGGNNLSFTDIPTTQIESSSGGTLTVNSNITLDAGALSWISSSGTYIFGDGTAITLPPTDTDDFVLTIDTSTGATRKKVLVNNDIASYIFDGDSTFTISTIGLDTFNSSFSPSAICASCPSTSVTLIDDGEGGALGYTVNPESGPSVSIPTSWIQNVNFQGLDAGEESPLEVVLNVHDPLTGTSTGTSFDVIGTERHRWQVFGQSSALTSQTAVAGDTLIAYLGDLPISKIILSGCMKAVLTEDPIRAGGGTFENYEYMTLSDTCSSGGASLNTYTYTTASAITPTNIGNPGGGQTTNSGMVKLGDNFWIIDTGTDQVVEYTSGFAPTGNSFPSGTGTGTGITTDGHNLFVLDRTNPNEVLEYTTAGIAVNVFPFTAGPSFQQNSITFDGEFFYISNSSDNTMYQFDQSFTATGLTWPTLGDVRASTFYNGDIVLGYSSGTVLRVFSTSGEFKGTLPGITLVAPQGLDISGTTINTTASSTVQTYQWSFATITDDDSSNELQNFSDNIVITDSGNNSGSYAVISSTANTLTVSGQLTAETSTAEVHQGLTNIPDQNRLNDDFEVTNMNGVILTSPDGSRWRITVDNTGTLITTLIP